MRLFSLSLFCLSISTALFAKDNAKPQSVAAFQENKGQLIDQHGNQRQDILFYGDNGQMSYFLKKDGISYQLSASKSQGATIDSMVVNRVDISWVDANPDPTVSALREQANYLNYYNSKHSDGVLGVRNMEEVTYKNIYPDIDVVYYHEDNNLKYDYIVRPHANPGFIKLKVSGATNIVNNNNGTITMSTPLGDIVEGAPKVYQDKKEIKASWTLAADNELSISITGEYDHSKTLIIDPLVYNSEILTGDGNQGGTAFYDTDTHIYTTTDWRNNTYQITFRSYFVYPNQTSTIVKRYADGVVAWSYDYSWGTNIYDALNLKGIAVDSLGQVYASGTTPKANLATSGAYQTTVAGGNDAFLIKFDSSGVIQWKTYYGGDQNETGDKCITDAIGNVYLCGSTGSSASISTSGAHQTTFGGGSNDAYIAKFNTNGVRKWATYYGGSDVESISEGASRGDKLYVCGTTYSANNIATSGAHQPSKSGSHYNGYVVCLDTAGVRQWATYYGGDSTSIADIKVSNNGDLYFSGNTYASVDVATSGTHQTTKGGINDGFLVRMDQAGNRKWATYFGGTDIDNASGCALYKDRVYIAGSTLSPANIATPSSYKAVLPQPSIFITSPGAAYLAEFDTAGQRTWATYDYGLLEGTGYDCLTDSTGNAFLVELERNSISYALYNLSITKFTPCNLPIPIVTPSGPTNFCLGSTVQLSTPSISGAQYIWLRNDTLISGATSNTYNATTSGNYRVWVDSCPTSISAPIAVTVYPKPTVQVTSTQAPCGSPFGTASVIVSGGTFPYTYSWTGSTATDSFLNNLSPGNYAVTVQDANGCGETQNVTVGQQSGPQIQGSSQPVPCTGVPHIGSVSTSVSGGNPPYSYVWAGLPDITPDITGLAAGDYSVTVTDAIGCSDTDTFHVGNMTTTDPSDPLVSICAVSTDTVTGKNMIVWEKTGSKAQAFNVYRETSIVDQYDLIGTQTASAFSTFVDATSTPAQQSHKYKVSELDSCGNEWPLSDAHKTIHLSSNVGINGEVNLSWNVYEGKSYVTHYIMRNVNNSGFVQLAQLPSNTTAYTDVNAPSGIGNLEYRIEIDLPAACNPTAKTTSISRIASNEVLLTDTNGIGTVTADDITVLPNPTKDRIEIIGTLPAIIKITDATGRLVMLVEKANSVSLQSLAEGVYLMQLFNAQNELYYHQKVVKQ